MNYRRFIVPAILCFSMAATAQIVTLISAVETSTGNMFVPTSLNGNLSFRPCADDCEEIIRVRLTAETDFVLHGVTLEFSDFRREYSKLPRGNDKYALVSYDTENNTVTSVKVGE